MEPTKKQLEALERLMKKLSKVLDTDRNGAWLDTSITGVPYIAYEMRECMEVILMEAGRACKHT